MSFINSFPNSPSRALALAALLCLAPVAPAQSKPTQVHDASPLKPPTGHNVAIIEFYDLECPLCAQTNPTLISAASQYKIPWIRYDLLIPGHPWSRQAAINARFFGTRSAGLGNDYRDYILANQRSIETLPQLQQFTQRFADAHKVPLPFAIDPTGKFTAEIQADLDLGRRIGVEHTPTIFIVASGGHAPPYTEVTDPNRLFQTIDQVLSELKR
jgi:protein-disulfide isomerase